MINLIGGEISYSFTRFGYNSKRDDQGWNIVISLMSNDCGSELTNEQNIISTAAMKFETIIMHDLYPSLHAWGIIVILDIASILMLCP